MPAGSNRQWTLARRPAGIPQDEDFRLITAERPEPGEDEVLVQVLYAAMDPAIRNFLNESGGYRASLPLGAPIPGIILGRIVISNSPSLAVGDLVYGFGSWSEFTVAKGSQLNKAPTQLGYDTPLYLHALGTIGLTAYYGLTDIGRLTKGETVLISGAAGAVGSLAGQFARHLGAGRVIGIAGGQEKCARAVNKYGFDTCIDYKAVPSLVDALREAAPDGIDLVFENIGGDCLAAAVQNLRKNARIALCGLIAQYNAAGPQAHPDLWNLIVHTAEIKAFRVADILPDRDKIARMFTDIDRAIKDGAVKVDLDIREGIEGIPQTFRCLFTGQHVGRLLVKIAD